MLKKMFYLSGTVFFLSFGQLILLTACSDNESINAPIPFEGPVDAIEFKNEAGVVVGRIMGSSNAVIIEAGPADSPASRLILPSSVTLAGVLESSGPLRLFGEKGEATVSASGMRICTEGHSACTFLP